MTVTEAWVCGAVFSLFVVPGLIALVFFATRAAAVNPEARKPYQRVGYADGIYGMALKLINDKVDRGEMTKEERAALKPLRTEIKAALVRAQEAVEKGKGKNEVDAELLIVKSKIEEMMTKAGISIDALPDMNR